MKEGGSTHFSADYRLDTFRYFHILAVSSFKKQLQHLEKALKGIPIIIPSNSVSHI